MGVNLGGRNVTVAKHVLNAPQIGAAVEKVAEDYKVGGPEDWTWPENRIDQWGISDKQFDTLREAEQRFRFRRDWDAEARTQA